MKHASALGFLRLFAVYLFRELSFRRGFFVVVSEDHNRRNRQDDDQRDASDEFAKLLNRYPSNDHHEEDDGTQQCGRGEILHHDEWNDKGTNHKDIGHCMAVGATLSLHGTQHLSRCKH